MLLVDRNEADNQPALVSLVMQSILVQIGSYNQTTGNPIVYPDFTIVGGSKVVGNNRKTVNEICSSIDRVEEQLQRELAGPIDQLTLIYEGIMVPDGEGFTWAYTLDWGSLKLWKTGGVFGTLPFKRQRYKAPYKGIVNWLTRLEWLGIQTIPSYSIYDTASKLVAMHDLVLKGDESKTLNRLIKVNHTIGSMGVLERNLALSLMGIEGARIGQELALTIASSFHSIAELIHYWDDGGTIADMMMRSGTRRIGNAAENNLKKGLGWQSQFDTEQQVETSVQSPLQITL